MFDEIEFERMKRLPNYVFAQVNAIKMEARRAGVDVIDFSMGNPDGETPKHIVDKLKDAASKPKNYGYSASIGIYKLRLAICNWYKRGLCSFSSSYCKCWRCCCCSRSYLSNSLLCFYAKWCSYS